MKRLLIIGGLLLTAAGQSTPPVQADLAFDRYSTPARLVALTNGRTLNLDCRGTSGPTVLLFSGLTAWSEVWVKVHDKLAQKRRVCAFDPAGFGFSGPSKEPQDAAHIVSDFEAALVAAGVTGPFIVVGHSAGGLQALIFTDRHKGEVAGMVLVDPSYPGLFADFDRVAPNLSRYFQGQQDRQTSAFARCAGALALGITLSQKGAAACFVYRPEFSDKVRAALAAVETPERMRTKIAQVEGFAAGSAETVNPNRNYGDLPLIVLTRGNMGPPLGGPPAGMSPEAASESGASDRAWITAHAELAKLSSRGEQRFVAGASHMIQLDKPEAVLRAIEDVAKAKH